MTPEISNQRFFGHITIRDKETGEILVDKDNAVNAEAMSATIALGLADTSKGHIERMDFGNGGSTVSGIGAITYFPPNVTGMDAQLYNQTYSKIVDQNSPAMPSGEQTTNFMVVQHTQGTTYSDIIVTCTLAYNEPAGQDAFDDSQVVTGTFVFDELGLRAFDPVADTGPLLTHVIFNPVQKSLNRVIEIVYTLRIFMT